MKDIKFEYDIGDQIKINAIEMLGCVDSLLYDSNGIQYRIVYWNNGQCYSIWMYDWEIETLKKSPT